MSTTYLAIALNILWKLLINYGYDPDPIFRKERIDPDLMKNPEARVLCDKHVRVWKKATEIIKDQCFGLRSAKFWHPSYMNALGYAWLASNTLREALNRMVLYSRIVSEGAEVLVEDSPEGFTVDLGYKHDLEQPPALTDAEVAIIMAMCRINYGVKLNPIIVHFVHEAPSSVEKYVAYFNSNVVFGSTKNSITFSREDVDLSLSCSNQYLAELHDKIIINYMAKLDAGKITGQVR